MALVCSVAIAIEINRDGFVPHSLVIQIKDTPDDRRRPFIYHWPADNPAPLMAFLSLYNFLSVAEGRTKNQVALMRSLLESLHDLSGEIAAVKFCHPDEDMFHEEIFRAVGPYHRLCDGDQADMLLFK